MACIICFIKKACFLLQFQQFQHCRIGLKSRVLKSNEAEGGALGLCN